ncbi:amine oxidase, flavin-containing domain-containing protein, putative [Eimeria necatrix]|uniref:Amine oxidase, flavin-containing domain-containing protein, putative n=1 Tax=Eimeria necatrix TaxID=51315 RepID=U6MJV0_9EIME|nr:amine oxidase, flavin-containing domain-containing protein, putative [Eimeria necatrix]CDJ63353.1 amine oxidase, flavin-containing domain-containing protein, putative [Eimeria necatrix]
MLPHEDGLAAPEDKSSANLSDHQSTQDAAERQSQHLQGGTSGCNSPSRSDEASDQGGRDGKARRRRRLGSSPSAVEEAVPETTTKRKRTPSRRVVEAAESALLLEEVIANESLAGRSGQHHPQFSPGSTRSYVSSCASVPFSHYESFTADACHSRDVSARVASLRELLRQQQQGNGGPSEDFKEPGAGRASQCSQQQIWGQRTAGRKRAQARATAETEEIPLCRRALFGAVEPRDLLGFGIPLREVLGAEELRIPQQQPHQQTETKGKERGTSVRRPQQQDQQQQQQGEVPSFVVDVAVVGAGVAGLAAAAYLRRCGASVIVFEGRQRVGGRTFSSVMPERELPDGRRVERVVIDLGASYMHCVSAHPKEGEGTTDCRWRREPSRSVSGIAAVLQPLVADVAGKQNWESTLFASWNDENSGKEIPFVSVLKVHQLLDRLRERTAAKLLHLPPPLTPGGSVGPPAASLPNTIPAAEFLSPSLDQILLAALKRERSVCNAKTTSPSTLEEVTDNTGRRQLGHSGFHKQAVKQETIGVPRRSSSENCENGPSSSAPPTDQRGFESEEEQRATEQHDPTDPCCHGVPGTKGKSLHQHISPSRFSLYYPLGDAFVRRAIRAYGGCPLCCTGVCGGIQRKADEKATPVVAGAEDIESRKGRIWGPTATLVPPAGYAKTSKTPTADAVGIDVESADAGGFAQLSSGGHDDKAITTSENNQRCAGDIGTENRYAGELDSAPQQPSPRKDWTKRQSGVCTRTRGSASSSSNSTGQPGLKISRPKKCSTAGGAYTQTRLVPPLSLHDNRGVRRSAWDALQISLCEILAEAEAEEGLLTCSTGNKEASIKDCRVVRHRNSPPLTPTEARMLLVVLQSRLGYVGDLRELPLSAVKNYPYEIAGVGPALREQLLNPQLGPPPVPLVVPPPPSMQRLRMQQSSLEAALQQEQNVRVYPFSASSANSADKLVVDGWGWLPLFLCLQVSPFVVTEATVQSICVKEGRTRTSEYGGIVSSDPVEALKNPLGKKSDSPAGVTRGTSGDNFTAPEEEGDCGRSLLTETHPVRLRVEVNRRLRHSASHGLPQAEKQEEPPTHVWAHAKYCVVAVPLAQLALSPLPPARALTAEGTLPPTLGLIDFSPPLGPDRRRALARYRMGCHNKVVIRWHPDDVFWHGRGLQLNCLDQKFQFLNLHAYGKPGCLLAHCFPPFSSGYGGLLTDQEVVAEVLALLQRMFGIPDSSFPRPVDFVVSRWDEDCFSRGSYSTPGVNAYDNDLDIMRAPHPANNPRVVFCGEHLSKAYFQCVDGAYDTGLRAAEAVAHECLQLPLPPREDGRNFALDYFCLPPTTTVSTSARRPHAFPGLEGEQREGRKDNILLSADKNEPSGQSEAEISQQPSQGLLPQCPFSGFPMPPLPRVLCGHYLTDQSDLGLTDAEGEHWGETGSSRRSFQTCESERRVPQVAAAEEYFLAHCLSFIKRGSLRLLEAFASQHPISSNRSRFLAENWIDGVIDDGDLACEEKTAGFSGDGDDEAAADRPPTEPPVQCLSETALSFLQGLPTAAQRLFYRSFLSEFPLTPPPSVGDAEQGQRSTPTLLMQEQQGCTQNAADDLQQQPQRLPLLSDFLDALIMCTSSNSGMKNSQESPLKETVLLLSQAFARRLKRGSGGKTLNMEAFLLLLAKNNEVIRDEVLKPIREMAHAFPRTDSGVGHRREAEAARSPSDPAAAVAVPLEVFVKELMLPAFPAYARNTRPPRMAAVSVGVLLMETLERLCAAIPPLSSKEQLQEMATVVDSLVLKNLANSYFISAIGGGSSLRVAERQTERNDTSEPLQHEQLCWLCRGEGDLLLCDGMPASALNSKDDTSGSSSAPAASRSCRHVFHIGCAFPPPTPAELQPNAHWSCPLCKAKAFSQRMNKQQNKEDRREQLEEDVHGERWLSNLPGQEHQLEKDRKAQQQGSTVGAGASTGLGGTGSLSDDLLHHVFGSLNILAEQGTEKRTKFLSQRQLAACEELQMAALKRLFVDKARSLLARTRQLCKRLDELQSKRIRSWVTARRRKFRTRSKTERGDHSVQQPLDSSETQGVKAQVPSKQTQSPELARRASRSCTPCKDKASSEKAADANTSTVAADALKRRRNHVATGGASGIERKGENLQVSLEVDEQEECSTVRRTRSSTLAGKLESRTAAAFAAATAVADCSGGIGRMDSDGTSTFTAGLDHTQGERTEFGDRDVSAGSHYEASSDDEAERTLDPFAAAAQNSRFARALSLFSQIHSREDSSLPRSTSVLQHLHHTAQGCHCNRQERTSGRGIETHEASSSNTSTENACTCGSEASSKVKNCLCVQAARKDATAALRSLLVFEKRVVPPRHPVRSLAPHVCSHEADIEALAQGEPFWLNRLFRPWRRRRISQPRRIPKDASGLNARSDALFRQQRALLHAARLQMQQSNRQPSMDQQQRTVASLSQRPTEPPHLQAARSSATVLPSGTGLLRRSAMQLQPPISVQQPASLVSSSALQRERREVSSETLRSLWHLVQTSKEQEHQPQYGHQQPQAETERISPAQETRLQQQLRYVLQQQLQQQELSAALLQAAQRRWPTPALHNADCSPRVLQQLAHLRTIRPKTSATPQGTTNRRVEHQLERQLQELLRQQRLQDTLRSLQHQAQRLSMAQSPISTTPQQGQAGRQVESARTTQQDVLEEQRLRQTMLRLQQLQRQLLLLQQQHRSD